MTEVARAIQEFVNNSLGVNLVEMVIQIASTVVLFLVVRFTLWHHITDYLDRRKAAMKEEYDTAKRTAQEAQQTKEQADQELHEIRQSAKTMYNEAKERGEAERQTIVQEAKQEATRLVEQAHEDIERDIEQAKSDINNEIVTVATMMAEKIIAREIDPKKHKDLIKDASQEVLN
jgi:F-type H+-transporting ATPase subunit b